MCEEINNRRLFTRRQKRALYILAGGKCEACGIKLEKSWHGDHVKSYIKGGDTDVINGQALCAECNLKKGSL